MPGGQSKFQEKWLEILDSNGDIIGSWCAKGRSDIEATCSLCKSTFSISNNANGISQILAHASRIKHLKARQLMKGQSTWRYMKTEDTPIPSTSTNANSKSLSVSLTTDQLVTREEALWAIKVAASDYTFESSEDIVPLFQRMFENHSIAERMELSEKKISYVISHGLGPYFRNEIISDLKCAIDNGGFFILSLNEAKISQVKKQLDLHLRYWSPKSNSVLSSYFTSLFFRHADTSIICKNILDALKVENISIKKILMLSTDGPNVNLSVVKKLNDELLKLVSEELVDIGLCSLPKVHNCFTKALSGLPLDIENFCVDLFYIFKHSAVHREDLQNLQKLLECEEEFFLRRVNSKWLTLGRVVERMLDVYESLKEYFINFLPRQKNSFSVLQNNARYDRIVNNLNNPDTPVYLEFAVSLTLNLQEYVALFQTEGSLVHMLYNKMDQLSRCILLMFIKEGVVSKLEGNQFLEINLDDLQNYKSLNYLTVGICTKEAGIAMRSCLVYLSKLLIGALPLTNPLLRDLEILHPSMRKKSISAIHRLCLSLKPLNLDSRKIDRLVLEWQAYSTDPDVTKICERFSSESLERIDTFWNRIFDMKGNFSKEPRFPNLPVLIKNCLILAHGNADLEPGFSINNIVLAKKRLSTSEASIIGLRHIKDAVKRHGGIHSIPVSGKLLSSVAKSYSAHAAGEEDIAEGAEVGKRKRKAEEEVNRENEQKKKMKLEILKKIEREKEYIEHLQRKLNSLSS